MSNKYRGLYNGVSHLFGKEVVVLRQDDNIIAYVMVDEIISVMQEGV
jgi:hypothetical protein